jgi:hypothetical protein
MAVPDMTGWLFFPGDTDHLRAYVLGDANAEDLPYPPTPPSPPADQIRRVRPQVGLRYSADGDVAVLLMGWT